MGVRTALLACAVAVWASACAHHPPTLDRETLAADDPELVANLERIASEGDERLSLRAIGRLRVRGPSGRGGVREIILAQRPARLRLESHNLLGQATALLVTDGERFTWYDGAQMESGAVGVGLLRDRLGLALSPEQAVSALLAALPAMPLRVRSAYREGDQTVAVLDGWRVHLDTGGELSALAALEASGGVQWAARYLRWRDVPGGRYPQRIELEFPGADLHASFEPRQVEMNAPLARELFRGPHDGG